MTARKPDRHRWAGLAISLLGGGLFDCGSVPYWKSWHWLQMQARVRGVDILWPDGEMEAIKGFVTEFDAVQWSAEHSKAEQGHTNNTSAQPR
jgi:hypothetical protein